MNKRKKEIKETALEIRRLRKEIKDVKAKKLLLPKGNEDRIKLGRQLKGLKQELKDLKAVKISKVIELNTPEPAKDKLIADILKRDILLGKLGIDLKKFSIKDLQKHLDIITKKGLPG